jgi:hypothetical protein
MSDLAALKAELCEVSARTDAGFESDDAAVARIKTLAAQVEALNPTPAPNRRADLLDGRWKLLYSSFGLERDTNLRRLSFATLPRAPISVTAIYQEVGTASGQYDNVVGFTTADGTRGWHRTRGVFKPAPDDDNRILIDFISNLAHPEDASIGEGAWRARLGVTEEEAIEAPIKAPPGLYSDITYLDADLRLMRGNIGNLYVLVPDRG